MNARSWIHQWWNCVKGSRSYLRRKGRKWTWHCDLEVLEDRLAPANDFLAAQNFAVPSYPSSAVGDFNADGKLDISPSQIITLPLSAFCVALATAPSRP